LNTVPKVKESWGINTNSMKDVKKHMKQELLELQDNMCAFCMTRFRTRVKDEDDLPLDGDREHIAPKSIYPQFIFEPMNLVLACPTCNRTLKNDINTIKLLATDYQDCEFYIVHPILDTISEHFIFERGIIKCISDEANWSDEVFQLSDSELTSMRVGMIILSESDEHEFTDIPFNESNI
jgi:uncharacterized protein (TIGR02646 family)